MQVFVTTESHFLIDENGVYYSDNGTNGYSFWKRYLQTYESVIVLARVSPIKGPVAEKVEGDGVRVFPLPGYVGPVEYAKKYLALKREIKRACEKKGAFILRVPGTIGTLVWNEIRHTTRPFGVEIVGDPYDVFARGANRHPLRQFFRWLFTKNLKQQANRAIAASYVTATTLQRRYPSPSFKTDISSIDMGDEAYIELPRPIEKKDQYRIVCVGTMCQPYKGQDILLEALAKCIDSGVEAEVVLIGDGKYRNDFENRAKELRLEERVKFLGNLPAGSSVREQLDQADLFVLPSKTEGLPRAIIEAMARALPCIGTDVGGIPELLDPEDLVAPNDSSALAAKIIEVLANPERMAAMSRRNYEYSLRYHRNILTRKRNEFYQHVRVSTEEWQSETKL